MTMRTAVFALALAAVGGTGAAPQPDYTGLVVHEWGTFTTVAGPDGWPVEWRPLDEPEELPRFVYVDTRREEPLERSAGAAPKRAGRKQELRAVARLETPVLYFYAPAETRVSVKVAFPEGRLTEWYPAARAEEGLDWGTIEVRPGAPADFPVDDAATRYYAARETDAAPLRIATSDGFETERFLFYRGVGRVAPSLVPLLERERLVLQRTGSARVGDVILFESRDGRAGFTLGRAGPSATSLARPVLDGRQSAEDVRAVLERLLVARGLYPKEAAAMLATWGDTWFEDGARLFYLVPPAETGRLLPLALSPRPAELVRVLVGRLELVTSEDVERARAVLHGLPEGAPPDERRAEAHRLLGRFGEPALRVLAARELRWRARVADVLGPEPTPPAQAR